MRKKKEKGLKLFLGKKQRGGTLEISGKEQDLGVLAWVSGNQNRKGDGEEDILTAMKKERKKKGNLREREKGRVIDCELNNCRIKKI